MPLAFQLSAASGVALLRRRMSTSSSLLRWRPPILLEDDMPSVDFGFWHGRQSGTGWRGTTLRSPIAGYNGKFSAAESLISYQLARGGYSTTGCRSFHNYRSSHSQQVFVSRHNESINVTSSDVLEFCASHGVDVNNARTSLRNVSLEECPFCEKPTRGRLDNKFKLSIKIGDGAFNCFRCGAKGSWFDFKARLGGHEVASPIRGLGFRVPVHQSANSNVKGGSFGLERRKESSGFEQESHNFRYTGSLTSTDAPIPCLPMPIPRISAVYSTKLLDSPNGNEDDADNVALDYLVNVRKLNRTTLRKYGVGSASYSFAVDRSFQKMDCITFPWIMRESDVDFQESLRGARFVAHADKDETQRSMRAEPDPTPVPKSEDDAEVVRSNAEDDLETECPIPSGKFVTRRIKVRAVHEKGHQRLDPPGGGWGLFGLHTVPDEAKEIVLTEGEFDAMSVWQKTGRPAVSLPNGCRSLPIEVLPLLERFEKIYLWMDNDGPGQEGAEKFAKKLGVKRCLLVRSGAAKDANDALKTGVDMDKLISCATVIPHDRVLQFSHLKNDVLHELLHPDEYKGVPVPSLPGFTKIVKGFRRGEMTVLTGPTGSGKTTFLSQLSLDLAEQGVNTLWGSFEIKNTRLLQKLLQQFGRTALPKSTDSGARETLEALASRFQELPMFFLGFHGGSQLDDVLDAMEYAVYVSDVEHIILDNMQFMITRSDLNTRSSFDKFDVQDIAIEKFRKFATSHNVHVTLVVHPRKEDETMKLNMASFYGSAKATQEADTVIILQKEERRKYIEVKKNRWDGELGISPIYFDRESGRYTEDERGHLAGIDNQLQHVLKGGNSRLPAALNEKTKNEQPIDDHWNNIFE